MVIRGIVVDIMWHRYQLYKQVLLSGYPSQLLHGGKKPDFGA